MVQGGKSPGGEQKGEAFVKARWNGGEGAQGQGLADATVGGHKG